MELNVSAVAASRLAPMLHADKALILDINDGIGPYSRPSKTSGQAKFNLLILPRTNVPDVYDAHLDSPVGPVLIKSYTRGFFKAETELTVSGDHFAIVPGEPQLDPNVRLKFV